MKAISWLVLVVFTVLPATSPPMTALDPSATPAASVSSSTINWAEVAVMFLLHVSS